MADPLKIATKIAELNRESANQTPRTVSGLLTPIPQVWKAFDGYNTLTKFDYNNGSPLFTPSVGIPLKAFLNTQTGEIKTFVADIFE